MNRAETSREQRTEKRSSETLLSVLLILFSSFLAYGILIGALGFYRDDWYLVWTWQAQGAQGMVKLFRGDRPFIGWLYTLDFSFVGISPLHWQVYGLVIKIAAGLAFLWLMRSLWPKHRVETTIITLLFIVYPGYYQQANALTFKMLMAAYTAALLSLALTVQVMRTERLAYKAVFTIVALLLSIYYLLIYEALIGLEAVRLLLILYLLRRDGRDWQSSLRSAWRNALPYLSFALLFGLWRVFIFQSTRHATDSVNLAANFASLHGFIHLLVEGAKDLFETSVLAWGVPFYQFSYQGTYTDFGLALGLAALVVAAAGAYIYFAGRPADVTRDADDSSASDWMILGALIIAITTLPVVAAGRNALFSIQWDRYTYQSALGAALLAGGFVFYALRGRVRWIILALLLTSGVATQVFSQIYYRDFWTAERNMWWQLYWRAPQIADGTTVIASLPGAYQVAEEYEVWGPLNLMYRPGRPLSLAGQIPVDHLDVDLERGIVEDRIVRDAITVHRDYSRALVVAMPTASSCLHVYGAVPPDISLIESINVAEMVPYSRLDLITFGPLAAPAVEVFGREPDHNWCFYYQKIRLALQAGDWTHAAALADEVQALGLQPSDPSEWMAPVEAYANHGDDKKAKRASTFINDKETRLYLCQQLKAVSTWPPGVRSDMLLQYLCNAE